MLDLNECGKRVALGYCRQHQRFQLHDNRWECASQHDVGGDEGYGDVAHP